MRLDCPYFMDFTVIEKLLPDLQTQVNDFATRNANGFVARLRPRIGMDGSHWWVQHGTDMQSGMAAFAPTLHEALDAFEKRCAEQPENSPRLTPNE